jgi:glyoxylase-like metal-dependent hydrolase (beta-lactamase superfamily II)
MSDRLELVSNDGWDPRILVLRCGRLVDVFLVVTERYLVVVDTLFGQTLPSELLAAALPYLETRTLLVINTHADWDHAWGNHLFVGEGAHHPAAVIGTRRCAERLRSEEARTRLAEMHRDQPGRFDGTELTPPTILFEEQLAIDGGDLTLELFVTPGHQPDHCSIWIPEIRTLLAGDAAEAPFPFANSAAALPQIRSSLAIMASLNAAAVLYCHAPTDAGPALLESNLGYFDLLEQRCRAALAAGVSAHPPQDADLEALVGLRFEDSLPFPTAQPEFYRPGHVAHLRMMLEWCAG